ncbi:MAG: DUF3575 domain-containing protein [Bacteroidales bacterium]|nr:DUF3575 domain-containing protein [Bacteroidales bacterium]
MNILKKLIILSILSFLLVEPVISQDTTGVKKTKQGRKDIKYPNIIKINSLALTFSNISLLYESGILPRLSAGIGVGYKYAGVEPKLLTVNNSRIGVDIGQIQGFSITPDVKYYLKTCDPGLLEGFYAGLYFRYTHYSSDVKFGYVPENSTAEFYRSDIALNEYGVGIQLGYQLMIKERFSIDFLFFGPRFSSYHLGYEFDQTPSQEFLDDLSEHLNEIVDRFGFDYDVNVKKEGNSKASTSFSFANTRFGLSLGYAF